MPGAPGQALRSLGCGRSRAASVAPVEKWSLLAPIFGHLVDFFSLGTNDLTQYTLAIDRTNPETRGYYDSLNPAVLRLVAATVAGARACGIRVGICGELAEDLSAIPLLIGLGLTDLSVAPPLVARVKEAIPGFHSHGLKAVADRALELGSADQVTALLAMVPT